MTIRLRSPCVGRLFAFFRACVALPTVKDVPARAVTSSVLALRKSKSAGGDREGGISREDASHAGHEMQ